VWMRMDNHLASAAACVGTVSVHRHGEEAVPRGTALRNIRIDDELWAAVQAKAAGENRTVSDVVRDLLRQWVTRQPATLMIDGDDDRWAFAEMPDRTWKIYERTTIDDRIWTEVARTPTYEDAINVRNELATNGPVKDSDAE
jgi:Arc/MetJ family transcription regulator